ncbi:MAG TPA: hypothetical protein VJ577_05040 [Burkholderiaceae bacterium]|nr:hypothetical protein [Burkholderiaceae bacterium]
MWTAVLFRPKAIGALLARVRIGEFGKAYLPSVGILTALFAFTLIDAMASVSIAGAESMRSMHQMRDLAAQIKEVANHPLAERSQAVEKTTRATRLLTIFGATGTYLMIGGVLWLLRREKRWTPGDRRGAAENRSSVGPSCAAT